MSTGRAEPPRKAQATHCRPFTESPRGRQGDGAQRFWTDFRIGRYNRGTSGAVGRPGAAKRRDCRRCERTPGHGIGPMIGPGATGGLTLLLARRPLWDPRLFWATLALIGVLLVGALVIGAVERWRKRPPPPPFRVGDQLAHFRTLYERGELSAEEFARIRGRLTERIVQDLDLIETAGEDRGTAATAQEKLERTLRESRRPPGFTEASPPTEPPPPDLPRAEPPPDPDGFTSRGDSP